MFMILLNSSHIYISIPIFQFMVFICMVNTVQCVPRISREIDKI